MEEMETVLISQIGRYKPTVYTHQKHDTPTKHTVDGSEIL